MLLTQKKIESRIVNLSKSTKMPKPQTLFKSQTLDASVPKRHRFSPKKASLGLTSLPSYPWNWQSLSRRKKEEDEQWSGEKPKAISAKPKLNSTPTSTLFYL